MVFCLFVCFSAVRETEKCSQASFGLSGAAARALNVVGSLGNTSGSKTRVSLRCKMGTCTCFVKMRFFSAVGLKSRKRITFRVWVAKCLGLRWSVGDLETSQGSISILSLDSGYHPH